MARRSNPTGPPLLRFARGFAYRKADYEVDFDAPGYPERMEIMFGAYERSRDEAVTSHEYVDPVPSAP